MFGYISGKVIHKSLQAVIVGVGEKDSCIGYKVLVTPSLSAKVGEGQKIELYVSTVVREDSITLYGFPTKNEVDTFEILIGVSGIGPKIALTVLSVYSPSDLENTVEAGDIDRLTRIPGIGKKGAQKLILELSGKLVDISSEVSTETGVGQKGNKHAETVTEALKELGWHAKAAKETVLAIEKDEFGGEIKKEDIPNALKYALQVLGRRT
jgi:Holliday junction DNA helicase RuvA